jgi:spermidine synthase
MALDLRSHVAAAVIGASAAALVTVGLRALAPFSGTQLDVRVTLLGCTLLGFAAGLAAGRPRGSLLALAHADIGLLVAGAWVLPWPWLRGPLLRVLDRPGLPAATLLAPVAMALVPAFALGIAFAHLATRHARDRDDPGAALLALVSVALVAAWGAAFLAPAVLIPHLGTSRSLLLFALLQFATAFLVRRPARSSRQVAVRTGLALLALGGAAGGLWRAPVVRAAPEFGVRQGEENADSDLRVLDRDEVRYLLVDGVIVNVADPVTGSSLERGPAAMRMTGPLFPAPARALVLGMRGGALAMQLARSGWAVTVVEPNPQVVETACRDFGLGLAEVAIATAEPRAFLRQRSGRYEFAGLDLSGSGALPPQWLTREFFALVRSRLEPATGVLAVAVEAKGWEDVLVRSLAATLRTVFPHVVALPTSEPPDQLGCVVLLAAGRALACPDESLPDVRAALGDSYKHWVAMQQTHAWFNRYEPATAGARLLTDDRNSIELWAMRIDRAARREVHEFFGPHARAW